MILIIFSLLLIVSKAQWRASDVSLPVCSYFEKESVIGNYSSPYYRQKVLIVLSNDLLPLDI